jgi:malonyl-CoA/methylmalonyl-CoA synthetase
MLANLLDSLDLPAASRIAVQVEKSVESLLFYLAVLRAGHVYLPLNTAYKSDEIGYFIGDAEPAVFVCAPKDFVWASKLAFAAGTSFVFTLGDDRSGSLLERATHFADSHTPALRASDDLAAILYTSGTTGRSKGAMLTHGNLLSNAVTLKTYWGWRSAPIGGDVLIHALPIFHVHGLFVASHGALLAGAKMLWLGRFDARRVVELLPRATVFMGVPTLYVRLLGEPTLSREACRNMRLFISGSAPLLLDTFEAFRERTGHTILERYGMSETVMLTSNPYDPPTASGAAARSASRCPAWAAHRRRRRRGASPGHRRRDRGARPERLRRLLAHAREDARRVQRRRLVSHRRRRRGRRPRLRRHRRPQQGPHHQRRLQRLPAEIEGVCNELPGVAETAVVGVPHADFGEAVVAVVVPRAGATVDPDALTSALKAKIANFKVPKAVFVVAELPRNAMGKVQKNLLREQHKALFA